MTWSLMLSLLQCYLSLYRWAGANSFRVLLTICLICVSLQKASQCWVQATTRSHPPLCQVRQLSLPLLLLIFFLLFLFIFLIMEWSLIVPPEHAGSVLWTLIECSPGQKVPLLNILRFSLSLKIGQTHEMCPCYQLISLAVCFCLNHPLLSPSPYHLVTANYETGGPRISLMS